MTNKDDLDFPAESAEIKPAEVVKAPAIEAPPVEKVDTGAFVKKAEMSAKDLIDKLKTELLEVEEQGNFHSEKEESAKYGAVIPHRAFVEVFARWERELGLRI